MERIEIQQPRFAAGVAVVCCAILLPLTLYLPGPLPAPSAGSYAAHLVGRSAGAALLGYLLFLAVRVFRDTRPLLVIDRGGVSSSAIRPAPLAWRQIAGARRSSIEGLDVAGTVDLLCIRLADPSQLAAVLRHPPGLLGWLARRRRTGTDEIEIDLSRTTADIAALVRIINANAGRRGGPA